MSRTFSPASELLTRHFDLFKDKKVAIVGQILDVFAFELSQHCESLYVYCSHFGQYRQLVEQTHPNTSVEFTALPQLAENLDSLILYMPKAKAEAAYILAQVLPQLKASSQIFIVGENNAGVRAAPKLLQAHQLDCQKIDSARRCSLYFSERTQDIQSFDRDSWLQEIKGAPESLTLSSYPGVFSHGKLDEGTQLLLAHLPSLSGDILDFGCGCGVIALSLASNQRSRVSGLDVSAYAIASCQFNQQTNALDANFFASDGLSEVRDSYDFIVSNPPFHEGTKTFYETSERFLAGAKDYLKPNGELWLVANKFLAYEAILSTHFKTVEEVASNGRFKILAAK